METELLSASDGDCQAGTVTKADGAGRALFGTVWVDLRQRECSWNLALTSWSQCRPCLT